MVLVALVTGGCGEQRDARERAPAAADPTPESTQPAVTPTPTPVRRAAWPHAKVLQRLAGRSIRIGEDTIRVDASTVTCGGIGRPAGHTGGEPAWRRFRCVQPTFPPGSVAGPDAIFFVEPVDRTHFVVTDRRLTRY
jgi:hypothetical protein